MLVITITAMFLITTLAVAVLSITTSALYNNSRQQFRAEALNIAESGAEVAALWLKDQTILPSDETVKGPIALNDGTYTATITPDEDNDSEYLKTFIITSVGNYHGVSKTVEIVIKQSSFGKFAYFTDSEVSSVTGGTIWWRTGESVDGPVHSNCTNNSNFSINWTSSATSPIFKGSVTSAGSKINYYNNIKPTTEAQFKKIFLNGSKGYTLGVDRIKLPDSSDDQKIAAWGGETCFPTTDGVYMSGAADSGIYIEGNATIVLSLDCSGNQVITVVQTSSSYSGGKTTTVTKTNIVTQDRSAQTTAMTSTIRTKVTSGYTVISDNTVDGGSSSMAQLTNGVIYCSGNITSLSGTVADNLVSDGEIVTRSQLTIATDVNEGKDITITNNIKYNTKPNKTLADNAAVNLAAGTLGLVARDITISSTAPSSLEIDAVMMAGGENTSDGSFSVANYDTKKPTGTLTVLGGIIQKARGAVGTFNSSTGTTSTGYAKNYSYDPRLAKQPPPYYPTTGTYDRLSWRVLPD